MKYEKLIEKMTLEQKASLMSGKNFWETMDIPELGIPSIFLADGPHGIRKQAAAADHLGLNASIPATCFPTAATMANSWNEELGEQLGKFLGEEALVEKVNVLLGPGTCLKRNPLCGRNFEYFSEDPYLAGKMAASYIRGIQSNGISACVKHFAANNQEERRQSVDTIVDERTLRELYLTAFEIAIKEGKSKSIMSSYNLINGTYANEHEHLLRDILRNEWGFNGVIVTDWGGDNDRVKGLIAGNELEMPTTQGETNLEIIKAIKDGSLKESYLNEAVDRLLTLIFSTEEAFVEKKETFDIDLHHKFAQIAAEESIVLLKNKNNALPLKEKEKIAIIGDFAKNPRFQGAGSSVVNPTKIDNTLEFIKEYDLDFVGYAQGFNRYGKNNKSLLKKACELAKNADTLLIYLGLDEVTEAEGLDRVHLEKKGDDHWNMDLPKNQLDLVSELSKLGKKIVIILSCGSVVRLDVEKYADAVVHGYLGGQAGSRAMLNVIVGKVNPSGKLNETYPFKYLDVSSASNFLTKQRTVEYREGIYVGYRYFETAGVKVHYPFGFGLSYTTFEYSNLEITKDGVSFDIRNTGKVAGSEIAQMYVGGVNNKVFRPKKELKGFKKIFLLPNETKHISIPFDDKAFRYFNVSTNKWEVEGCDYNIMIGKSVEDIVLEGKLFIEGTTKINPYNEEKLPSYYSGKVSDVNDDEFKTLLNKEIPDPNYSFYKRKRMVVHYNTTVAELRYAPGWTGRFFAGAMRFAINSLRRFGKRTLSNTLIMGVYYQPMRGLSRMTGGAICWGSLDGLILMFNGHFHKGLHKFFKERKIRKKYLKSLIKKEAK